MLARASWGQWKGRRGQVEGGGGGRGATERGSQKKEGRGNENGGRDLVIVGFAEAVGVPGIIGLAANEVRPVRTVGIVVTRVVAVQLGKFGDSQRL